MLIVPKADALTVEARIVPQEIDGVHVGQRAVLRFSAFNQRTTPELNGVVSVVSADISADQKTGASFYTVWIAISGAELARLGGLKLVPGMPVESFIQTEAAHRAVLPDQAPHRPSPQSIPRKVKLRPSLNWGAPAPCTSASKHLHSRGSGRATRRALQNAFHSCSTNGAQLVAAPLLGVEPGLGN